MFGRNSKVNLELNREVEKLIKTGGKPLALGFCCWVGIASMSLIMQHVLGIW